MAEYVKQVWEDGVSPVNAERLNHMEEGIAQAGGSGSGGNVAVINVSMGFDDYGSPKFMADKSYADIVADTAKGIAHMVVVHFPGEMVAGLGIPVYQQMTTATSGMCEFGRWIRDSDTRMAYEYIRIAENDNVEIMNPIYVNCTNE